MTGRLIKGRDLPEWWSRAQRLHAQGWTVKAISLGLSRSDAAVRCAVDPAYREQHRRRGRHVFTGDAPDWVPRESIELWRDVAGKVGVHRAAVVIRMHMAPRVKICGSPPEDRA